MKKYNYSTPLIMALMVAFGMFIGVRCHSSYNLVSNKNPEKNIEEVLRDIENAYVDKVDEKKLSDDAIAGLLQNLDPHSVYIPAEEARAANEELEGNFEGIGVEFSILNDTIVVVTAIAGGPSEQLGIRAGDRIIKINGKSAIGFKNEDVFKTLRGPKGTEVKVTIERPGEKKLLDFDIKRGKIPIYAVDAAYIAAPGVGYIKINRFGANTMDEYNAAFNKLKADGMKSMILDLRGNPGGYLKAAIELADEYLPKGKRILYTQGEHRSKEVFDATKEGSFEEGKLAVLIDEGSASASEIVAGALQDHDRATIIGRRSFGKGLVQESFNLSDGAALRLTVARYYTPSGRSIQRSYAHGTKEYYAEIGHRLEHGEFFSKDSIHLADSLKYHTDNGRTVYGGGGIMPDIFVSIDTVENTDYVQKLFNKGAFSDFALNFTSYHRESLMKTYKDIGSFASSFSITPDILSEFQKRAEQKGVKNDSKGMAISSNFIRLELKALIARQLFGNEGYYRVLNSENKAFKTAVSELRG